MQPTTADAVKRVLTMAGVTGAALTLTAGAALPAFADHGGDDGDQGRGASQSQSAQDDHSKGDTSGGDAQQSKPAGDSQDGKDSDGHNPPGNNGTVKIHQTAGDTSPHNVPHVDCSFYVSFFGFDNSQPLNVTFTGQAPTGKDAPIAIKDSSLTSKTSTTDAGGAGNDYDGDLGVYDGTNLDLSGLGAPAKQGYHIKLDVATGEPGGHKYKVFWFTPCTSGSQTSSATTTNTDQTPTATTTQTGGTTDNASTTPTDTATTATTGSSAGGATVLGESLTRGTTSAANASTAPANVLGEKVTRSAPGLASLPFTGSETGLLSALGLAALGGGAALTVAGRRRRAASGA